MKLRIPEFADPGCSTTLEHAIHNATFGRVQNVRVTVDGDQASVTGYTGTYYTKQLAQHAMMKVLGEKMKVVNDIEVRKR